MTFNVKRQHKFYAKKIMPSTMVQFCLNFFAIIALKYKQDLLA